MTSLKKKKKLSELLAAYSAALDMYYADQRQLFFLHARLFSIQKSKGPNALRQLVQNEL